MWATGLWLALLAAVALFCRGFLPPTRVQTGYSDLVVPELPARFDKLVVMVVDALRSDFVYAREDMAFVHSLIGSGKALPFTAYSDPPTVTLPRLKGLTTGGAPNFLDAVVNIAESDTASVLANQDSWVAQMTRANKTIHMYGDDTWLKLFPETFAKVDGTSSFYVADYTEVDFNVTRHLDNELLHQDWDCLILHYLGLDHIGHKGGPNSRLMGPKLREMDGVVEKIWHSLSDDTLLMLAGDHGMNEVGNHGGASSGETSAALVLASKNFNSETPLSCPVEPIDSYEYFSKIQQVDIVTSLAVMFGLPIPLNSLGTIIPDVLGLWKSPTDQSNILSTVCRHFGIEGSSCSLESLQTHQASVMRSTSSHVLPLMLGGLALIGLLVVYTTIRLLRARGVIASGGILLLGGLSFAAMQSSSFIEEEHYVWFWGLTTLIVFMASEKSLFRLGSQLLALRLARGWHGAGQKWASIQGSAEWLVAEPAVMWGILVTVMIIWVYRQTYRMSAARAAFGLLAFKLLVSYQSGEWTPFRCEWAISPTVLGRLSFGLAALHLALEPTLSAFEIVLALQSRPENIPLLSIYAFARANFAKTPSLAAATALAWQYVSFFSTGGSNSMATLDLTQAYNGVSGYNIPLVGSLGYLSNWAGPIYWALAVPLPEDMSVWFYSINLMAIFQACTILREHLFIWTVFSPKLLYAIAWLVHQLLLTVAVKAGRYLMARRQRM